MYHIAFLVVCYILGTEYHSGQWSKGYRLLCLADTRARREHSALNLGRIAEHLKDHRVYAKGSEFRNAVAYFMKRMRHHRHNL